jgi:ppGpp synthetase/RelA/SpoT-type nucleotidyltranferase
MENGASETDRVALEALSALAGADAALKRLVAGLSMGSPSIEHATYHVKARIKEHGRLVDKVFDKRKDGKPKYCAGDATDIIGLRILTLYRSDLPAMVQRFLKFVEQARNEPLDLFPGATVRDAVEEVIVYGYPKDRQLCQEIIAQLEQYDLKLDDQRYKHESRPNGYSSIHILLRMQVTVGETPYRIPLEVQIRSILEDAWGQVEHELIYKSRINPNASKDPRLQNVKKNLRAWKDFLDTSGDMADNIKEQIKEIFSPVASGQAMVSVGDQELRYLNLPAPLQRQVDNVVTRIEKLSEQRRDPSLLQPAETGSREWSDIAIVLQGCIDKVPDDDTHRKAIFLLNMELSLCLLWIGRLMRKAATAKIDPTLVSGMPVQAALIRARVVPAPTKERADYPFGMSVLDEAVSRYFKLQSYPGHADDAMIAYRLGEVFWARDEPQLALPMFETADRRLKTTTHPPEHPIHMLIPRRLGYAYWESAEALSDKAKGLTVREFLDTKLIELYADAIAATHRAYEAIRAVGAKFIDPGRRDWLITINNLVDYCVAYRQLNGPMEFLDELGLTQHKLREFLNDLTGDGDMSKISTPGVADTIRLASHHFGHRELQIPAARRVIALLDERDWTDRYTPGTIATMRNDADEDLAPLAKRRSGRDVP